MVECRIDIKTLLNQLNQLYQVGEYECMLGTAFRMMQVVTTYKAYKEIYEQEISKKK